MDRIRDEQAFGSRDELMAAITRDVACCRQILEDATVIGYRDYLGGA
jgi:hypothetical protein